MSILALVTFTTVFGVGARICWAGDGATEALELRYQAELAIAQERVSGNLKLADAMQDSLGPLLQEYLITRDGTIASDTVDAVAVQTQYTMARAAEDPGVALALEVFTGRDARGRGLDDIATRMTQLADFDATKSHFAEGRDDRFDARSVKEGGREPRAVEVYDRVMRKTFEQVVGADRWATTERIERFLEAKETHQKEAHQLEAKLDTAVAARGVAATEGDTPGKLGPAAERLDAQKAQIAPAGVAQAVHEAQAAGQDVREAATEAAQQAHAEAQAAEPKGKAEPAEGKGAGPKK